MYLTSVIMQIFDQLMLSYWSSAMLFGPSLLPRRKHLTTLDPMARTFLRKWQPTIYHPDN